MEPPRQAQTGPRPGAGVGPRIQYAQTADGVSIAYWTIGDGMPLVHMPSVFPHIQLEWQMPEVRSFYERLAEKRKLIRYDDRGFGLSQRDVTHFALIDSAVLDLEAVVDRLGLERFALFGPMHSGPVAITFAARHPERVSRLVLWCTYTRAAEWTRSPQILATRALIDHDWETYTETAAHAFLGWSAGEPAQRFAALIRESATPESVRMGIRAVNEIDVADILPQVGSPTLVLHRRQLPGLGVDIAMSIVSRIPDARLALLEGTTPAPYLEDTEAVLEAIDEFLGGSEEPAAASEAPEAGAFRTVLFTDVEGSTALTQRLGDARARELLREHERMVREALTAHGGSEVKALGDGFMTSFTSATRALECAIAVQRAFAERNRGAGAALAPSQGPAISAHPEPVEGRAEVIRVRIGLNAGEPIAEDDPDGRSDLYGTAVNLAARIAGQAKGGEILVANVIRELAAGKDFLFADRGEATLRGFDEPVRLFEVRWHADATPGQA